MAHEEDITAELESSIARPAKTERSKAEEHSLSQSTTRKRKTEIAFSELSEVNPWTKREILELLVVHENYEYYSKEQKAKKLHSEMAKTPDPEKPMRTGYEVLSKIRELASEGMTIEKAKAAYNAERNPSQKQAEPPQKTPKKKAKADEFFAAKAILQETDAQYKISWEDDEETGETFADSWEPKEIANQSLIDDWDMRKAKEGHSDA